MAQVICFLKVNHAPAILVIGRIAGGTGLINMPDEESATGQTGIVTRFLAVFHQKVFPGSGMTIKLPINPVRVVKEL